MTEKEQAEQLLQESFKACGLYSKTMSVALLVCDKLIIQAMHYDSHDQSIDASREIYWRNVQKELEKL